MCLIAYIPKGKVLTREVFDHAHKINSDGIGVMSQDGVEKFYGHKFLKKARGYVSSLAAKNIAHAVHWRFATHGDKSLALCHPFKLPNGKAWIMHNGVISQFAGASTKTASDTLLYVDSLKDAPTSFDNNDLTYWNNVCTEVGSYNKIVVMFDTGDFVLCNKDSGTEKDGIWYSNSYSLPDDLKPQHYYKPARLQDRNTGWSGSWYPRNEHGRFQRPDDVGAPFGAMLTWSSTQKSYGYWSAGAFITVKVEGQDKAEAIKDALDKKYPLTADSHYRRMNGETCKRCYRPLRATAWRLGCVCPAEKLNISETYVPTAINNKPDLPCGPTMDDGPSERIKSAVATFCEHGLLDWAACAECIHKVEGDEYAKDDGNILYLPTIHRDRGVN
jgi:hypothetical protein